jgi:sugar-specific transcriptional regulator TrmB
VKSKDLTASGIHNACGVARPDVDRVLGELEKAGLVEKIISRPENFQAISVEECVSTLLQRRITKTLALQKKALKLSQTLEGKTGHEVSCEKFGFSLIEGKDAVYAKAGRMI